MSKELPPEALLTSLRLAQALNQHQTEHNPKVLPFPYRGVARNNLLMRMRNDILELGADAQVKGYFLTFLCEGGRQPTMTSYANLSIGEAKQLIGELEVNLLRLKQMICNVEEDFYVEAPDNDETS